MDDSVTMRPLHRDDYPTVIEMMRRMWYASVGDACARRLAAADLHHCLSRSTVAMAAERDGEVVGVILGRVAAAVSRRRPLPRCRHVLHMIRESIPLPFSAEGRRGIREALELIAVDAHLIRGIGSRYDAEIVLFLVDERVRGRGVGRMLFDRILRTFRNVGANRYFLFTDTTCDVGFYDHRGLTRFRERRVSRRDGADDVYYLYEGRP
ncbi:GNAT family N-acetyltransferase [Bifidobacterium sp. MA2]|uniref:GNAT family N-acetyltransferase n=2 Tax=Bifidobacterium santillanense TaxID=2809028 RepID=A0ABS5UM79_9BIFI|nr:GNAT family N-acetyltransferase [Bifidobacterium santillanense]